MQKKRRCNKQNIFNVYSLKRFNLKIHSFFQHGPALDTPGVDYSGMLTKIRTKLLRLILICSHMCALPDLILADRI